MNLEELTICRRNSRRDEPMLDFIRNHWAIIFSGIGTTIVAAVLTVVLKRPKEPNARAGDGSQIVQAGRDSKVGDFHGASRMRPGKK
jgi:hypothetical protein